MRLDKIFIRLAVAARDEFREEQHPRAENGQFTSAGGGSGGSSGGDKEAKIAELKSRISKLGFFGEAGKQRSELKRQLKELEGNSGQKQQQQRTERVAANKPKKQAESAGFPVTERKQKQFDLIQKTNPMSDDYHVGIRKASDIRSPDEAFNPNDDEGYSYPDFTREDGERALKTGRIKVYSSRPIKQGGFVSPSKRMAGDYSGGGRVYEMEVPIEAVAWINADEGQFANLG